MNSCRYGQVIQFFILRILFAGASAEEAASVKGMTLVQKITQDNNNFIVEKVLPKKTVTNKFTIGQPATITNIRGKEIEVQI